MNDWTTGPLPPMWTKVGPGQATNSNDIQIHVGGTPPSSPSAGTLWLDSAKTIPAEQMWEEFIQQQVKWNGPDMEPVDDSYPPDKPEPLMQTVDDLAF